MDPLFLIAYDIADHRRLARVHRYLKARALPVQFSVFLTRCSPDAIRPTAQALRQLINPRRDDVRIYRLPEHCDPSILGRPLLLAGAMLLGHPTLGALQPAPSPSTTVAVPGATNPGTQPATPLQYNDFQPDAETPTP